MGKEFGIIFVLILICVPMAVAADFTYVITNSENWIDVFSGIHFSTLSNVSSDFLTSTTHGKTLLNSIEKENSILVVSSKNEPYVFNYPDMILSEGYDDAEEIIAKNLNLELINELPEVNNFIIVDSSYGYSGIAVVPYAVETNSWIFFADKSNVDQIDSILAERNVKQILIYGYVDREVRETLEDYNPKIIYNQNKFEDNIEIVDAYLKLNPTKQVLLSNGEFIEKELMSGVQPILFTGEENVPDQIAEYLKNSDIEIGVLIGNELMGAATNIRRSTGISVMVKFARGARSQADGVSAVEGLDLFPVPSPILDLQIYSVEYNTFSNQLEITYKSSSNLPVYLKGTITIKGDKSEKLGDVEAVLISPGNYLTLNYSLDLSSSDDVKAQIYTIYGESKSSLDKIINEQWEINFVDVVDTCDLEITKVDYNKQKQEFEVHLKNKADVSCWADATISGLTIGYDEETVSSNGAYKIEAGKSMVISISQEMTDGDLNNNQYVNVISHFGQRETSLVKFVSGNFELNVVLLSTVAYMIIVALLAVFVFLFLFLWKRKKEEDFEF